MVSAFEFTGLPTMTAGVEAMPNTKRTAIGRDSIGLASEHTGVSRSTLY